MKNKMTQIDTTGRGRLRWSHKSAEVLKDGWSNERGMGRRSYSKTKKDELETRLLC